MTQTLRRFTTIINAFPCNKVLCIGDIMLDEYIAGLTERISPEAPVPVIHHLQTKRVLGGVGNVAANLTALGCQASIVSAIGNDSDGQYIENMLQQQSIHPFSHKVCPLTTKKQRIIAQKQQVCRVDFEEKLHLSKQQEDKIIYQIAQLLPQHNVVILSDYNKGLLTPRLTQTVIQMAQKQQIPVLVDPKGNNYRKYEGASLIKPNLKELNTAIQSLSPNLCTHLHLDPSQKTDLKKIQNMAHLLRQILHIDQVVVTLSEHGMVGSCANSGDIYRPTAAKAVSDVSGAGDTSLAVLSAGLGVKATLTDAIDLANIAAGVVVAKKGTATLTKNELNAATKSFLNRRTNAPLER